MPATAFDEAIQQVEAIARLRGVFMWWLRPTSLLLSF